MSRRYVLPSWGALVLVAGCAGDEAPMDPPVHSSPPASGVVVGLGLDPPLEGIVETVAVRAMAEGATVFEDRLAVESLPQRLDVAAVAGEELELVAEAWGHDGRLFERRMAFTVPAKRVLASLWLTDECLPRDEALWRDRSCPTQTCVAGRCVPAYVDEARLPAADAPWPHAADECGSFLDEPRVSLGLLGEPFMPLESGQELVPERGLQGASHVWLTVEVEGVSASAGATWLTGAVVDTGQLGSFQAAQPGYEVEGDVCHRHPVRYVLPFTGAFEETLRLSVIAIDPSGRAGSASVDVYITDPPPP